MPLLLVSTTGCFFVPMEYSRNVNVIPALCEGETDIHASTSFEFGLMNDLYYQLFHAYDEVDK